MIESQWAVWGIKRAEEKGRRIIIVERWFNIRPRLNLTVEYEKFQKNTTRISWRNFLIEQNLASILSFIDDMFENLDSDGKEDWDWDFNRSTFFNQQILTMSREWWLGEGKNLKK